MSRARLKKIFRAMSILILVPVAILLWLIGTESGLNWIYQQARPSLPGKISIAKLQGSLISTITVLDLNYQQDDLVLKADRISLDWHPAALISNTIDINQLHVQSLNINLPTSTKSKSDQPVTLPEISLPWRVVLKEIVIDEANLNLDGQNYNSKQIKLSASSLFNQVSIKYLDLVTERFQLNIKGQVKLGKHYPHKLDFHWQAKLPANTLQQGNGQIEGDLTALRIKQQLSGPMQIAFNAEVRDLLTQLNWNAEANITEINPALLWPEWQGKFQGKLTSQGKTVKGKLNAVVELAQLSGTLRDYPVSLQTQLSWRNTGLNLEKFDLRSGKTRFTAQGRMDAALNFNWSLISPNLAELVPGSQGQLQAKGQLTGSPAAPVFSTSFNGKALRYSDVKIEKVKTEFHFDLFHWKDVAMRLNAQTLHYKEFDLQTLDLFANNKQAQLRAVSDIASLLVELKGEFSANEWQGSVEKVDLRSSRYRDWQLRSPARLTLSKQNFSLETLCWHSQRSQFCSTIENDLQQWQARFEMRQFPLLFLGFWLPPDLKLEGLTNATAKLNYVNPNQLYGAAKIELPPGAISYPLLEGERNRWEYNHGLVNVTLNAEGLDAASEISMNNGDQFKAHLSLPNAKLLTLDTKTQKVQVSSQLHFNELGLIEAFIPEAQELKGEATINIDISGTLANPSLRGKVQLSQGSLRIPRLGLKIQQLSLNGQSDDTNKFNFQLKAISGEGQIIVAGQTLLNKDNGWPTTITIKGEEVEVSHIPVSQLVVSPDLQIKLQHHRIDVNGDIRIPFARLKPKDTTSAARISNDVVIINDKNVIDEKWSIYTKIRLTLGERVNFYGYGFEGRFGGNILLEDEPGQLTRARGEINVPEGRYTAYGQHLTVEHGRLLYTGGPITNPGLDLRAVRVIGDVTAGLKVRGSLNQPEIELFSVPTMGQTDMLAYLLLGRPIENATGKEGAMMAKAALALSLISGDRLARSIGERFGLDEMRVESSTSGDQASLVIGRYLSPKLYVGYGVGLIESFNTFNVRYQISDKWQLKGESGENQGADLLYTIER